MGHSKPALGLQDSKVSDYYIKKAYSNSVTWHGTYSTHLKTNVCIPQITMTVNLCGS